MSGKDSPDLLRRDYKNSDTASRQHEEDMPSRRQRLQEAIKSVWIMQIFYSIVRLCYKTFELYLTIVFAITQWFKRLWQGFYKYLRLEEHSFSPFNLGAATPEEEVSLGIHLRMWYLYFYKLASKILQNRISKVVRGIVCMWFIVPWINLIYPVGPYPGTRVISKKWVEKTLKRRGLMNSWSRIKEVMMEEIKFDPENEMAVTLDTQYLRVYRLHITYHDQNIDAIPSLIIRYGKQRSIYTVKAHDYGGLQSFTEPLFLRHELAKLFDGPVFPRDKFRSGAGYLNGTLWTFYWPWGDFVTVTQDPMTCPQIVPVPNLHLKSETPRSSNVFITPIQGIKSAFITLARLHSIAWNDRNTLFNYNWLMDWDLLQGDAGVGRVRWESLIAHLRRQWSAWRRQRMSLLDPKGSRFIPNDLEAFINESLSLTTWKSVSQALKTSPLCLRHNALNRTNCSLVPLNGGTQPEGSLPSGPMFSPTQLHGSDKPGTMDKWETSVDRPVTRGCAMKRAIDEIVSKHAISYRVRLDDWRRVGVGPPAGDIASAILLFSPQEIWSTMLSDDTILDCYYETLQRCIGDRGPLRRIDEREYSLDDLRTDVARSGMEELVIKLVKECSRFYSTTERARMRDPKALERLCTLVEQTTIWRKAFMSDASHVTLVRGHR